MAVSDLSTFEENDTSQDRYRAWQHEAFFEVKWMRKGWRGNRFEMDAIKQLAAIPVDVAKLAHHQELGRCTVAGMVVFDDESYFSTSDPPYEDWPSGVWLLTVGPGPLELRGLLPAEVDA